MSRKPDDRWVELSRAGQRLSQGQGLDPQCPGQLKCCPHLRLLTLVVSACPSGQLEPPAAELRPARERRGPHRGKVAVALVGAIYVKGTKE